MFRYALSHSYQERANLPSWGQIEMDSASMSTFQLQNVHESQGLQVYCPQTMMMHLLLPIVESNAPNSHQRVLVQWIDAIRNRDIHFIQEMLKLKPHHQPNHNINNDDKGKDCRNQQTMMTEPVVIAKPLKDDNIEDNNTSSSPSSRLGGHNHKATKPLMPNRDLSDETTTMTTPTKDEKNNTDDAEISDEMNEKEQIIVEEVI